MLSVTRRPMYAVFKMRAQDDFRHVSDREKAEDSGEILFVTYDKDFADTFCSDRNDTVVESRDEDDVNVYYAVVKTVHDERTETKKEDKEIGEI